MHHHRPIPCLLLYAALLWMMNCCCSAERTSLRGQGLGRSRPQHHSRYWKQSAINRKPNIVLILTDDQDVLLGSMSAMNKTKTVLGKFGANFVNAFVTTPMCCPSRSSILTGQYVHNHHVYSNVDHCGSNEWVNGPELQTFAKYLKDADYRTGYFGKYLNNYNGTYIPPGWTEWVGLVQNSKYYNYTLCRNGQLNQHGFNYYRDYLPDLIANDSLTFFKMSKRTYPDNPVAMVMSFPSPHGPEDGAPQYLDMFEGNHLHRTETWNFRENNDKHWLLRYPHPLTEREMTFTDILQQKRLISLLSVDDAIAKLCGVLDAVGELENTYIIFTSDHGYHLGQYGLPKGKSLPYDFDIRVPFYMRGPKIPPNIEVPNIVLNIDLAPTILDIAGVDVPPIMDGVSIMKLFNLSNYRVTGKNKKRKWRYTGAEPWRSSFLVERTRSPEDLERMYKRLFHIRKEKEDRLREQCRDTPELQLPCKPFQDKACMEDEITGVLKIKKCRRPPKIRCHCVRRSETPAPSSKAKGRRFKLRDRPSTQAALTRDEKRQQRDFIREHVSQANPPFRFMRSKRESEIIEDEDLFFIDDALLQNELLNDPKCQVYRNDTVMCDNEIFESRKAWVNHRKLIAARVRLLRKHLDDLKEIKVFLKDTKPPVSEKSEIEIEIVPEEPYKKDKPEKVCTCDNIDGVISEAQARELERLGDIYLENKGEFVLEVPSSDRGSRSARSVPAFGEFVEDDIQDEISVIPADTLSRKQRKFQNKQDCHVEGMKCTSHDNDHWRVKPFWTLGHLCLCLNSVNNSYRCLRSINETHDFLYCEFITDFLEYFDMTEDPHQKVNAITEITDDHRKFMRDELQTLKYCTGASNCTAAYKSNMPRKTVLRT
ncbi:extracellular sulfatase Sulf-1-like isoform X2 [Asterias rubens]|uniref:extracellular sulfatase Sulf-1-like isoform X2 n=1 Tax=Asterias rubens TaxID=7604 RepID=UPI001455BED5|nr:extracellular sulfatase Sulf-1-like isoform X2 [Asterias rubens]